MQLFQKKYPLAPFLFLYPWYSKSLRCQIASILRTRCLWLNVCCSRCRWCLVSDIPRCGGWRTRWRRCVGRGDGNGRSWRGYPMRRGCWRKKKRSCGSDKSAHDLGRDKSKNASILRKYGSICMGEKTKDYCRLLSRISRRMVGSSWICSAVSPLFSTSSATAG